MIPVLRSPRVRGTGTMLEGTSAWCLVRVSCVHDPKAERSLGEEPIQQVEVPDDALHTSPRVQVAGGRMRDGIDVLYY